VEADGSLSVRTYERGVEAETLACGTGATAVAVIAAEKGWVSLPVTVHCAGGYDLVIDSVQGKTTLTGGAVTIFEGTVEYGNRV
jgi:diaminopimelate epimerase